MRKSKWLLYAFLLGSLNGHAAAQVTAVPPVPFLVREEFYENENGPEDWRNISITSFLWASESLANTLLAGEKAEGLDAKENERLTWHQELIAGAAVAGAKGEKSDLTCAPRPELQADGRGELGQAGSLDRHELKPGMVLVRAWLRAVHPGFGLEASLPPRPVSVDLWVLEVREIVASRSDMPLGGILNVLAGPGRLRLGQAVLCPESSSKSRPAIGQEIYAVVLPERHVEAAAQLRGWLAVETIAPKLDDSERRLENRDQGASSAGELGNGVRS
jgi:hypothetical protein